MELGPIPPENAMHGRAFAVERKPAYDIQVMRERHHAIVRMVIQNKTDQEIARILDVTPQMVGYTRKSTIVRQKLDAMRAILDMASIELQQSISQAGPVAFQELMEIMLDDNTPKALKAKIAQDILDRANGRAVQNVNMQHTHVTQEDLDEAKRRAMSAGLIIEDAEVIEDVE